MSCGRGDQRLPCWQYTFQTSEADMELSITLTVNGERTSVKTDSERTLLEILREDLHLLGTRFGCGEGDCGACSVHIDGNRAFACQTSAADANGKSITTIEGIDSHLRYASLQNAFMDEGAYQCGYCVSGMIMAAAVFLDQKPSPTEAEIREGMNANLCRCCGYVKIVAAVKRAAADWRKP
jgi:aerobic-type carbon monoxide dehydrogenase small subunit (CoxS/CutS family)